MADETAAKEALQVAYSSAQKDLVDLEGADVDACQELKGEGGSSGSLVASRLHFLGGQVAERLKSAFRLGVQRALGMVSTHYVMDLERVAREMTRWLLWSRLTPPSRVLPPPVRAARG